jgi:manganese efflux pump family protein
MPILYILLLALSMAMDAFAVCLVAGSLPQLQGPRPAFRLAFHFGLFQFLMPIFGGLVGASVEPLIRGVDHWLALGLLGFVGSRMIYSALKPQEMRGADPSRGWSLILLSIAVSIDALAVGLSLGVLGIGVGYPAILIGFVTGLVSLIGLRLGHIVGARLGRWVQVAGGFVLFGIGIRIVLEHLASS